MYASQGIPPTHPPTRATVTQVKVNNIEVQVPIQDLNADKLLMLTPKLEVNGQVVPALGGIPLLAKIGQGGMGAVFYGIHPRLKTDVAVKVLPFHMASEHPDMIERFFREAQLAAKVKSPHLVAVLDVNEEMGIHFLVMEFIKGKSAGALLKASKAKQDFMDEATVLDICIAACEGLAVAHDHGVVHRDIKPDNILVPEGREPGTYLYTEAKVADLGLARSEDINETLTASRSAMGTPGYMAPEQANDAKSAGKPADIFSMGCTLYDMLCRRPPFTGATCLEAIIAAVQKPHPPARQMRPDISAQTASLIDRCLMKKPDRRLPDARALLEALKTCRQGLAGGAAAAAGLKVPPPPPPTWGQDFDANFTPAARAHTPVAAANAANTRTIVARPATPPRKSRAWPLVAGIVLLGAAVASMFYGPLSTQPETHVAANEPSAQNAAAGALAAKIAPEQKDPTEAQNRQQPAERPMPETLVLKSDPPQNSGTQQPVVHAPLPPPERIAPHVERRPQPDPDEVARMERRAKHREQIKKALAEAEAREQDAMNAQTAMRQAKNELDRANQDLAQAREAHKQATETLTRAMAERDRMMQQGGNQGGGGMRPPPPDRNNRQKPPPEDMNRKQEMMNKAAEFIANLETEQRKALDRVRVLEGTIQAATEKFNRANYAFAKADGMARNAAKDAERLKELPE